MKKILALLLAVVMVLAFAACGSKAEAPAEAPAPEAPAAEAPAAEAPAEAPAGEVTWADYQQYLIDTAGANAPDLDEFKAQVEAIHSWDEMPLDVSPWDQFFTTLGLSTWEEFQNGIVKELAVMGPASAEASEEPAAEEPAGDASGEPSGEASEPPASASVENTAHGGTPGATSEADYQAYLKAWLAAEHAVNANMTDEAVGEFEACIDAMDFEAFPGDMLFNGMLTTGSAMTYDQFVAANGVY